MKPHYDETIIRRKAQWRRGDGVVNYQNAFADTPWRSTCLLSGTDGGSTEVSYRHRSDLEGDIRDLQALLDMWNAAAIHIAETAQ